MSDLPTNVLAYGDNLHIFRRYIPNASVDLNYLGPLFNPDRDYNVIFRDESANRSDAQLLAFEDTSHWGRVLDKVRTIIATPRLGAPAHQELG